MRVGALIIKLGILVALLVSVVWAYGAYMWFSEPQEVTWGGRAE